LPGFKHYRQLSTKGWQFMMNFFNDQIREHKEFIDTLDDLDNYEATDMIYQFLKVSKFENFSLFWLIIEHAVY
jgi:hypothetical protein